MHNIHEITLFYVSLHIKKLSRPISQNISFSPLNSIFFYIFHPILMKFSVLCKETWKNVKMI